MKKILIVLTCFFAWVSLQAQQDIKFILKDSTSKQFNVSDIDSLSFIITSDSLKMILHDSLSAGGKDTFDLKKVRKIQFVDSTKIALFFEDTVIYRDIMDIDSLAFDVPDSTLPVGTVRIGSLDWETKNLDVDHYRNGDPIPHVTDSTAWDTLTTGAWCWYSNNSTNGTIYGKLYNWHAVNDPRGLAPKGWRIPTDAEWKAMITTLGGDSIAGGKLKEVGFAHWKSPNTEATNSSGFNALPGGFLNVDGTYSLMGLYGVWWTSTEYDANFSHTHYTTNDTTKATKFVNNKKCGLSVRCVKE
jgi:uncharacterized protein (TIGR02145 family)